MACRYCGQKSVVEWMRPRQPPAEPRPLEPGYARIQVQAASQAARRVVLAIVLSTALPLALAGFAALRASGTRIASVVAGPQQAPHASAALEGVNKALGSITGGTRVQAPDPKQVDVLELLRQMQVVAAGQQPKAQLVSLHAPQVTGGLVDATVASAANAMFEYRFQDSTKPPGQDTVEGRIIVGVTRGAITTTTAGGATGSRSLGQPKCSSRDAWQTAVRSGVPQNAVATFHLYDNTPFSPKSPTVWSIRVEGHDEHRREIDAMSCALVKSWAPTTKPRPGAR